MALAQNPKGNESAETLFFMGESLYAQGEYDLAIMDYQKVISNHADHKRTPTALLKQGISFEKLTDLETAKIIYKKLLAEYPDSAEAAYGKAGELDPDWGDRVFASCAYSRGELERAISMMESLIAEGDPSADAAMAYLMYAYTHNILMPALYYEAGRYSDAVRIMDICRNAGAEDIGLTVLPK